jgi:osmoprotectant transport system permease protein
LAAFFQFAYDRRETIWELFLQHVQIVVTALVISVTLSLLIGYLITFNKKAASAVLYICSLLMTIPSLALFTFFIPILGIGTLPAIAGLIIYTLLPVVRNTYVGLTNTDKSVIEAARGMGLTENKITLKIKIPLALPVIFAGIRTAVVMGIGLAAIAAYIGAGGLGQYIFQGINRNNKNMIFIGAILIALITITVDKAMQLLQKRFEKAIR